MIAEVRLQGHLTDASLRQALPSVDIVGAPADGIGVLIDALPMTGYDLDARSAFVDWAKQTRGKVRRIAIVTSNPLWRVVINGMGLATRQPIRPFDARAEAELWLNEA